METKFLCTFRYFQTLITVREAQTAQDREVWVLALFSRAKQYTPSLLTQSDLSSAKYSSLRKLKQRISLYRTVNCVRCNQKSSTLENSQEKMLNQYSREIEKDLHSPDC